MRHEGGENWRGHKADVPSNEGVTPWTLQGRRTFGTKQERAAAQAKSLNANGKLMKVDYFFAWYNFQGKWRPRAILWGFRSLRMKRIYCKILYWLFHHPEWLCNDRNCFFTGLKNIAILWMCTSNIQSTSNPLFAEILREIFFLKQHSCFLTISGYNSCLSVTVLGALHFFNDQAKIRRGDIMCI